ncbi:MAG: hypothetical protein HGB05_01590, partial [Chloroflexi bacterium]|nr:hypothetical protein [Chloroflexota bacterium]
ALRSTELFDLVPASVWEQDWVVHCKAVGNGETAFKYLAPYILPMSPPQAGWAGASRGDQQ